ncbi:MAG: lactonase family protein [Leptospiraceae bacterium]|nr:beta-propeller fold lactonase family protein [Leptospiraceae bacterium]MCK6381504.1 lactonase family protein [Leptospiraceae bacterium]NUM41122.1 beta-propeller fold lactonase family protein [Leptospiraceae bacterium]
MFIRHNIKNFIFDFRRVLLPFQITAAISFILLHFSCKNPRFENPCDPNSKTYQNTLFSKAFTGDSSAYCSLLGSKPNSITYSPTPYLFRQNSVITSVTPTITGGTPTSCTSSPTLPTGLVLSSNCVLSGTPTTGTAMTTYTITGSNSGGSATGSVTIQTLFSVPKYLYVTNGGATTISVFTVNSTDGSLSNTSTPVSGSGPTGLTIDPTGKFLYVVYPSTSTISLHTINQTDGSLNSATSTLSTGTGPQSVAIHPTGKFVYSVDQSSTIYQYTADLSTGALTSSGSFPTGLDGAWIKIDPYGKFLFVACQSPTSSIYSYSINPTSGALSLINSYNTGNNSRAIEISPDSKFLYSASAAPQQIDYSSIGSTGALSYIASASVTGTSSQSVAMDPLGRFVYLGYNGSGTGTIAGYTINSTTGVLTSGGTVTTSGDLPTGLIIDPSGKFLYSINSVTNTFYVSAIDQSTGVPTVSSSGATGTTPSGIAITGAN